MEKYYIVEKDFLKKCVKMGIVKELPNDFKMGNIKVVAISRDPFYDLCLYIDGLLIEDTEKGEKFATFNDNIIFSISSEKNLIYRLY